MTTNKTVLVTGGARRIGAGICRELHERGMCVIVHYQESADAASSLVGELNSRRSGSAHMVQADLGQTENIPDLVEEVCNLNGRLDVLVNNASRFYPTPLDGIDNAQWQDMMSVNLQAPLLLATAVSPELARRQGSVINLTDIHGHRPLQNYLLYSISKAGLVMLTQALAAELAPEVRVNAISPGAILWPQDMKEKDQQEILARIPLGRAGEVRDIALAVSYLVFDAGYTTGQVLTIDGGRSVFT